MNASRHLAAAVIVGACAFAQHVPFVPGVGGVARAEDAKLSGDLAKSIRAGDLEGVKDAVAKGADLNALDERKMPPIGAAALLGKVDIVQYMAEKGADVNKNDGFGYTPLMCAAQRGQVGAVRALLKLGADPALKGDNGNDAMSLARANGPADPLFEQKQTVAKLLKEAIENKGKAGTGAPAPAATATPAPAAPAAPAAKPQANVTVLPDQGEFDDLSFTTPDAKKWKPEVKDNNLVFSAQLPPPDFATITVFASRDLAGDTAAFEKAFAAAVDAELKAKGVVRVEEDGGAKVNPLPNGAEIITRQLYCEAKDFHTCHLFLGVHAAGRLELVAFQTSGKETFDVYRPDAQAFIKSLQVDVKKDAGAAAAKPAPAGSTAKPSGGLGDLLNAVKK